MVSLLCQSINLGAAGVWESPTWCKILPLAADWACSHVVMFHHGIMNRVTRVEVLGKHYSQRLQNSVIAMQAAVHQKMHSCRLNVTRSGCTSTCLKQHELCGHAITPSETCYSHSFTYCACNHAVVTQTGVCSIAPA